MLVTLVLCIWALYISEYMLIHNDTLDRPNRLYQVIYVFQKTPTTGVRPVWYVFSGMGSQWSKMGRDLMSLDVFKQSIAKSDAALKDTGLSVHDLIVDSTESSFNSATNSFVAIVVVQVC